MLQSNPVTWFEIYVDDLTRARDFYHSVFHYEFTHIPFNGDFEAYLFQGSMPAVGALGALMKHPLRGPSAQGSIVYFHCDGCDEICRRALEQGGHIFKAKTNIGKDGFIALIGDSEGNVIGVHSWV
jgi:uncharacterized protein